MKDRVVIVTGASGGIGIACVEALLDAGARVGATDLAPGERLEELLRLHPGRLAFEAADLVLDGEVERAHAGLAAVLGPADGLVCAAGILSKKDLRDTSMALWRHTFAVNVEGTVRWMQAVLESMCQHRRGSIVTFSSQLTKSGGRNNAAYIVSKAALAALARTAALECAEFGVRINTVAPGAIDTPMLRDGAQRFADPAAALERSAARHALGRLGTAPEIAACVLFLLSDDASFVTGAELLADGGWSVA